MKTFTRLLNVIVLMVLFATGALSQVPTVYQCSVRNDSLLTARIFEFDIYLLDNDPANIFELATFQAGILVNPGMANGGVITPSLVAGSSELVAAQRPLNVLFATNCIKLVPRVGPGLGAGTIISSTSPGTRVIRIRLTNSVDFGQVSPNFTFNYTPSPYNTVVSAYHQTTGLNTIITNAANHTVATMTNPILNAPVTAFNMTGGGSSCAGGTGQLVGLDGSQTGVEYKLVKDATPVGSYISGTGAALSFGLQTNGSYTSTAYRKATYLTGAMNGPVVIAEFLSPTASVLTLTGASCICSTDGSTIKIDITGGTSPYDVVYSDGFTNFTVNSYTTGSNIGVNPTTTSTYTLVSVTDFNGCPSGGLSGSAAVTVATAPILAGVPTGSDLGCNPVTLPSCDGTVTASNECGAVTVSCTPGAIVPTGCIRTQDFTYSATACGLTTTAVVSYSWTSDLGLPVISTTATSQNLGCNPGAITAPVFTGLDNCDGVFTPVVTTAGPTNTGCAYSQTWEANYTDACGNIATPVSITYTWTVDIILPVISTTASSQNLGCNPGVITAPVFTGLDNCDGIFTPVVTTAGPTNTGCAYSQTWEANYTDACFNAALPVIITYTWTIDVSLPVISTVATSQFLGCNPTVTAPVFTGLDNCVGVFSPVVTTAGPTNTGCAYSQTWDATYTDACGNAAIPVSITYTWTVDIILPVISTTATSQNLGCNPGVITAPVFTGLDNCDGIFTPVVTTAGPTNTNCAYSQTWEANYTDACLNAALPVIITYTWTIDVSLPVISTVATSQFLGCNPTVIAPVFTGLDNCVGVFSPVVTTAGPTNTGCAYSQTWEANYTDACGNAAIPVSITYTWTVDIILPVISTTATSQNLGCNPGVITAPVFTGLDNCDGIFTPVVTTAGPTNTNCAYSQTWEANYTDACLNAALPVIITYTWTIDVSLPVISTVATSQFLGCNPTVIAPVFTGLDNCVGVFSPVVTTAGPTNTGCAYSQTWDATYTDACGNAAIPVSITYTWTVDIILPVISTTATSQNLGCNPGVITAPVFTGLDNCDGIFTPVVTTAGPTNTNCAYSQTWEANYTDACLNAALPVIITYTWTIDVSLPVISTVATSQFLGCNPTVIAPVFTGLDNCVGVFSPVVTTAGPTNTGCAYSQTWDATYTDACGNAAIPVSITYTWTVDIILPVISTTATSQNLGCNPGVITAPVFTGLDNCDGIFTPVVTTAGPTNTNCAYSQTWEANYTDACLNAALPVIITYTWTIDVSLPVISTVATSQFLGCNPTVIAPVFTGLDNCVGVFSPVVTTAGPTNTGCAYSQTWDATYTDACGNAAIPVSITYTWTVDIILPVISTTATSQNLGCNPGVITAPVFTGLDNCDGIFTPVVTTAGPTNTNCAYSQTWEANYTDACLNAALPVIITYTWTIDVSLPVISTVATSQFLGCNPTVIAPVFTGLDNCVGVFSPVVTTAGPTNTGCAYSQTWEANYTDACGNAAIPVSITYTWTVDIILPVISTTATSQNLGCNPGAITDPVFTGLDNCVGVFTPIVTTAGPTNTNCAYSQTWEANYTDACLNAALPVIITYTWTIDVSLPVISTVATNQDLGCNPTVIAPVFTGLDNCDGVFTPVVTTAGPTNTNCAYSQTWDATYTDACGNAAIPVSITYTWTVDIILPVISTTATSQNLGCNPGVITNPVFTGLDNCVGVFTPTVTTAGPTNTGCTYSQTWEANYTDACLNAALPVIITYTWTVDLDLPVISTVATNQHLGCNPTVIAPVFTGLDNCVGVFSPVVTTAGPTNTGCAYSQTWEANYTDACGNAAIPVSITYTWTVDIILPVISTTATSQNLGCNPGVITAPVFTGLDNCDGIFTPVVTTAGPTNTNCAYSQTWEANYTDACLNAALPVIITYTWTIDVSLPVISTVATSQFLGCNPTVIAPVFTGLDNCVGVFSPVVTTAGPTNTNCAYSQTWEANYTDACGNAAIPVSITYTWTVDLDLPVISTVATSHDLGCNPMVAAPVFTGLDNCEGVFSPVVTTAGPTNTGCAYSQTWTANYTDACLNAALPVIITYTWTIDVSLPVISTVATSQFLGCNPTVIAPVFTGLDNCVGVFSPVVTTAGPTNTNCAYSQTWEANYTDACGNAAIPVSITYTWTVDLNLPVISTVATSHDLGCNPTVTAPVFTGLDNCDGVFTPVVSTAGPTNTGCAYSQTWEANYTDACLNAAIPVSITYTWTVDLDLPVISTVATSQFLGCNPTVIAPVFTGLDNCDGVFSPVVTTAGPTNTGCAYSQTWEANYTDACGNAAIPVSITYTWTVDLNLPVISTVATSHDLGCNPTVTAPVFTGLDNCDGVFTPVVSTAGPTNTGCAYSQTWTANYIDACLNAAIPVSITYTWTVDLDLPVISTVATNQDLGCNPTVTAPVFTGLDNCDGVFTPVVTTIGMTNTNCAYSQTWTANYTDACGNAALPVSITYTWTVDLDLPVISTVATSHDLGCNPMVAAPVFTGLDNCEGVFSPVVNTAGPTNTGCAFSQTWTANYTDACLNAAIPVSITYTWTVDLDLPVISTVATNQDLGCNPTVTAPVFTGLDNCDGVFTPVVNTDGPTITNCTYSQTWTANYTDACGNAAIPVSITYTWTVDLDLPVISTVATSHDLGCNPMVAAPVFTGLDNCEGVFSPVVNTAGPTNTGCAFSQTWTANYTDACLNAAIPVSITYTWTVDLDLPVISTVATNQDLGCNPTVTAPVFTGLDNCDGVFTPVVNTDGPTITNCTYSQTWTANYTDACGNAAIPVSITYTWIVDLTGPVFTACPGTLDLGCNPVAITQDQAIAGAGTVSDGCGGVVNVTAIGGEVTNLGYIYSQTWTVTATDACLNSTDCVILYTWTVVTAGITNNTGSNELSCTLTSISVTAFGGISYSWSDGFNIVGTDATLLINAAGTYTVTAMGANGCTDTESIVIIGIPDNTPPEITTCPPAQSAVENGNCQAAVPDFTATTVATDNCGTVVITQVPAAGTLVGFGVHNVTITATDGANLTATCVTTFTVNDLTPPVINTCPPAQSADANGDCQAAVPDFTATTVASDNCGTVVITQMPPAGTMVGLGVNNVTITATDGALLTATCVTTFTVTDNTPPVISTCPPAQSAFANASCQAAVPDFTATTVASDNCGTVVITQVPAAGTLVGLGVNNVTITATDGANLTATCITTFTVQTATISGTLKYNNAAKTPLNNVTLTLLETAATSITGADGHYEFPGLCAGTYTIEVTNINKPVGYINSTDASAVNAWFANQFPIEHVKWMAGDVNFAWDVNSTDSKAIQNYFVYFGNPNYAFTRGPWTFYKANELVNNNSDPNRLADLFTIVVDGNETIEIYGQAVGDFNGSFTPGNAKGYSATMGLVYNETKQSGANMDVALPLRLIYSDIVGSASLILNFPSDMMSVTGVTMVENNGQLDWSASGNELRIGWNTTQPLYFKANDDLLTIHLKTSETFSAGDEIRFVLAADPLNELADGSNNVIQNVVLGIDAIEFSTYGIEDPLSGSGLTLDCSPNPFAVFTNLTYSLPADGHVTLQISDMFGRKVSKVVDEYQVSGKYSFKFDALPLQPGVYQATIFVKSTKGDLIKTIKIVQNW